MRIHELINEDYGGGARPYSQHPLRRGDHVRLKSDSTNTVYTVRTVEGSKVLLDNGVTVDEHSVQRINKHSGERS